MPLSVEHKARTRDKIVAAAAGLLRTHGPAATGVAQVMKRAGLTHGGFYAHFSSKEEMVAAAFEAAVIDSANKLGDGLDDLPRAEKLRHYVGRYLSRAHRDKPAEGCPLAALGSDLARAEPGPRQGFEHGIRHLMADFEKVLPHDENDKDGEDDAHLLGTMAMMLGGLMLSRAVADTDFSDHILRSVRHTALGLAEGRSHHRVDHESDHGADQ